MHKPFTEALAVITIGTLGLSAFVLPPQARSEERKSCEVAIVDARERLEKGRDITVMTDIVDRSEAYSDSPDGRPLIVDIVVDGSAADSVMNSPVLQKALTSEIIKSCDSVGAVTFARYQSGWTSTIGLMAGGNIQQFECVEPGQDDPSWGQEYCGL